MTLPGMWGVERFGRRRLLLVGAVGMCICEYLVAIIGVTISVQNQAGQKALIALVCIYIAFFASTWGPIAWVVTGEIFPLNVRAKAMSMSTASNWLWNFGIGYASACHVYFVISVDADFFLLFISALPRQLWCRQRKPRCQGVLHLGNDLLLLHHLHLLLHS